MKKLYIKILICFTSFGMAQIPANYYNNATGTGYTLKTQLFNTINNNTNSASSSANYGGLWTLYTENAFRDLYYENDNSLLDVYSEKPTGPDSYSYTGTSQQCGNYNSEGDCYNREHTVPQSYFGGSGSYPMYSDAHFVLPSDGKVNAQRNDFPYGKVNVATWTSTNGSKLGSNLNSGYSAGYTSTVFEPIDEFKGDVARCLLYFVTRYQDQLSNFYSNSTSTAKVMFDGSSNHSFSNTFLNILLTWHASDPVSNYEIAKNNAVYTFQGNRNPFIDHPEWVQSIWGSPLKISDFDSLENIVVYPNPTNNKTIYINSDISLDEIELINLNGQLIQVIKNPLFINKSFDIQNLNQGFYFLKLKAENQMIIKKIFVN
ncbi:endonuclease [Flavobacterium branchiophilum]|uniref:Probable extracellular ribonuclease n=1 Tax=Flavobacterium branchiophilum (strain FL-15) TaxID=1034807 RepID=G2Z0P2_FLABF|nr:endonuclease [Flavobacterium branchiophilum]CCB69449.1 Probable extracellular ribonuclease precursor [Flavobacterium branchiophilum FL-15]